jgi:hypothetical protein
MRGHRARAETDVVRRSYHQRKSERPHSDPLKHEPIEVVDIEPGGEEMV